jgi:hypothetical protein
MGMKQDGYTKLKLEDVLKDKIKINKERPKMHGVLA